MTSDFDAMVEADREALMETIRGELYALDRGQLERLALRIGRSADCLARIRRGTTKWPYAGALLALARACGLKLIFVPAAEAASRSYRIERTTQVTPENRTAH